MSRVRIAVVGVGHLGKEHARILAGLPDVDLVGVADLNFEQAQSVARKHDTRAFNEYWPLFNLVDAACIVVPTSQHEAVAADFLRRGIPLLVEKPLAPTLRAAELLVELADKHNTLLQVGHIERFNPAFEEVQRRPLTPRYLRAERLGPFTGRSTDIGCVLDLMIHDLDLVLTLVGAPATDVHALGASVFGGHEDLANARLTFANGCVADVTASRCHPAPHRHMHLWGAEGYAGLDFAQRKVTLIQPSAALRQHGLDPSKLDPASRARLKEELFGRHLEVLSVDGKARDQLTDELQDFVHCLRTGNKPRVSGADGLKAIALAERILQQVRSHSWTGADAGPMGPHSLPTATGQLFAAAAEQQVA